MTLTEIIDSTGSLGEAEPLLFGVALVVLLILLYWLCQRDRKKP